MAEGLRTWTQATPAGETLAVGALANCIGLHRARGGVSVSCPGLDLWGWSGPQAWSESRRGSPGVEDVYSLVRACALRTARRRLGSEAQVDDGRPGGPTSVRRAPTVALTSLRSVVAACQTVWLFTCA